MVLGGAKVSDKLAVIENLITTADTLIIGGGMVFTFLAAQGHEVGESLLEQDQIETVKGYLDDAAAGGKQIVLPTDIIVAPDFKADSPPTGRLRRCHAEDQRVWTSAPNRRGLRDGDPVGQDVVLELADGRRGVG